MITTKYLKPAGKHPARIKASGPNGDIIVAYNDTVSHYSNHLSVAKALAADLGWQRLAVGDLPNGNYIFLNGYVVEDI
jgi:hypothetical protein